MAKANPKNYLEKDFTTEVMAWLNPYVFRSTRTRPVGPSGEADKTPYLHPETRMPLWLGPGWDAIRIKDENYKLVSFQFARPYDLRFTATAHLPLGWGSENYLGESHALELKLVKDAFSMPLSWVADHQRKGLMQANAQGINTFGWVVVQYRLFTKESHRLTDRETWAIDIREFEALRDSDQRGLSIEMARLLGYELPMVKLPGLEKSGSTYRVKNKRKGWDLTPLLKRQKTKACA